MIPEIATRSGNLYNFVDPNPEVIYLSDIVHSLARQVRYNGQIEEFYTIAQHSIVVARLVPRGLGVVGLLHDASEAYVADVPSPLKRLLHDYDVYEMECQDVIYKKFGIMLPTFNEKDVLSAADWAAGLAEAKLFFKETPKWLERRLSDLDNVPLFHRALGYTRQIAEVLNPTACVTGFHDLEDAFLNEYFTFFRARRLYCG